MTTADYRRAAQELRTTRLLMKTVRLFPETFGKTKLFLLALHMTAMLDTMERLRDAMKAILN